MLYLFLIATAVAVGEYFYFNIKLASQRKTVLLLNRQNENLRNKVSKQNQDFSTVNINYSAPSYKNGYTTENSFVLLSPLENSPVVFHCVKSAKAAILERAEILNSIWYLVSINSTNNSILKGWMKESDIRFIVDESSTNQQ